MTSIKTELVNGVFWTAISRYSGLVISVIVSMVLARLLTAEEFGIVAIANIFIIFLSMFSQMGIGPAIIQKQDLSNQDYENIFSISVYIGATFACIFVLMSWPISWIYNESQLLILCRLLSVNVFFSAINMVPNALMQKNKRFKDLAKATLLIQLFLGIISVTAAFLGLGIYSLIISPIILSILIFFYCYSQYFISFHVCPSLLPLKKILSFSIYQFLFEFINYFSRNLDKLIIGKMVSVNALGFYEKSYSLVQIPQQYITGVIGPVLQPILCKLQDNPSDIGKYYNKIISIIALMSFPIGIVLCFCSSEVILLMFGDNWEPAIKVMQIISLSLPTQMILSTSGAIWQSCNSTKTMFWVGFLNTIIVVSGFIFSAFFFKTIESVALSWTLSAILTFTITYSIMYLYILKSSLMDMLRELIFPSFNAILLACSLLFYNNYLLTPNIIVNLAGKVLFSCAITVPFILIILKKRHGLDIYSILINK